MRQIKYLAIISILLFSALKAVYSEEYIPNENCVTLNMLSMIGGMFEVTYERYIGSGFSANINLHYTPDLFWQTKMQIFGGGLGARWYMMDSGMKNLYVGLSAFYAGITGSQTLDKFYAPGYTVKYYGNLVPILLEVGYKWVNEGNFSVAIEPYVGYGYELGDGLVSRFYDANNVYYSDAPSTSTFHLTSTYYLFWTGILYGVRLGWSF